MVLLGWLVPVRSVRALERDRDHWRAVALKALGHTEQLMPGAEIAMQVTKALSGAVNTAEEPE
jgi:hypothetical protein